MLRPVPLPDGSYSDETRSFAYQDVVNLLPTRAEQVGARSNLMLGPAPGLQEYAVVPSVTRQRGARNVEGRLYFVAGTGLYQLTTSNTADLLGTIPGSGRVSISHNQIQNGNEVLFCTGSAAYLWNTVTSTLTQVTDSGFLGGLLADFIGARFVTLDPARRFFQNSELASGLEWNSSEYYAGESSPDRIRSLKVVNNEVVLLNESTIEHFAYTGETNALFENKRVALGRGCASSHAVSVMDNALFFIGNDLSGYEKRGYEVQRITTHAIEREWALHDASKAFSFVWEDRGHKVWYVTFPTGYTWGFDAATRKWHRRSSYGMDRWRLAWLEYWNGDWYGGEYNSGRVFKLNWLYPLEGSDPLSREFSPGILHQDGKKLSLHTVRVEVDRRGEDVEAESLAPVQVTGDLADGYVGDTVNYSYVVTGGNGPYTLTITAGTIPAGTTFTNGTIAGTYTTMAEYGPWTVQVTDANGQTDTVQDSAAIMPRPVGWWKLDESSGTDALDSSGNDNHGTYTGSYAHADPITAGSDGCLHCTTTSGGVSVPYGSPMNIGEGNNSWTVAASFMCTNATGGSVDKSIVGLWGDIDNGYKHFELALDSTDEMIPEGSYTRQNTTEKAATAADAAVVDTAYRMMLVADGDDLKLYLNGTLAATNSASVGTAWAAYSDNMRIGAASAFYAGSYGFVGKISDVILYDVTLPAWMIARDASTYEALP